MYYRNEKAVHLERIAYQNNRQDYLRLDLNENPGGLPEDFVKSVFDEITPQMIAQYPETQQFADCLAEFLGVKPGNLCLVNGSAEGIRHIIEAYTSVNGKIAGVTPSYAMYEIFANMYGRHLIQIPYSENLDISASDIIGHLSSDIQLLILMNPNNPIGNAYTDDEFAAILSEAQKHEITVLVDEAYMYFYPHSFLQTAVKTSHVFVTRTFSKLFSLGGCRLGYVAGMEEDIKIIQNLCTPHNTNVFAMKFAQKIIQADGLLDELAARHSEGRKYLIQKLLQNGYQTEAREGNFLFMKPKHISVEDMVKRMRTEKKILLKSYDGIGRLGRCIRVTTGERKYMELFMEALTDLDR